MSNITRFPLCWPAGRTRAQRRERSRFSVSSFATVRDSLLNELRLLGAKNVVLSANLRLRQDGLPLANQSQPDDTGVAVYFDYAGNQTCFACDRWQKVEDNMQAIHHTIEALRGIARWGTGDMLKAAFTGFAQLPAASPRPSWASVLGLRGYESTEHVEDRYRQLAMQYHPDRNIGDEEAKARYYEINEAYSEFKRERGL